MVHQKRLSAPKHYPIKRKHNKYVTKGRGPHSEKRGIPLTVLLRDVLEYAETAAESEKIVHNGDIKVNGRKVRKSHYTVGFMDTVSIEKLEKDLRVLLDRKGLVFKEVEDGGKKLYKVVDKTTLNGGETQLNFEGGENMVVDNEYSTRSSLLVDIESGEIEEEIPFEEGNLAFITEGKHVGQLAKIKEIHILKGSQTNKVILERDDKTFETVEDYVYMVGDDELEVAV